MHETIYVKGLALCHFLIEDYYYKRSFTQPEDRLWIRGRRKDDLPNVVGMREREKLPRLP